MLDDSVKSVRHERPSGWFSKWQCLAASVSFLPLPHLLIAELQRRAAPSGGPYPYGKQRETHGLIFSWLSWLAVLLVGAYAWWRWSPTMESRNMVAIIQIIARQRHAALVYCVRLWDWTSMLWSIDSCQNKVSAGPHHVTISWAQVCSSSRSRVFLKLIADQVLVFHWIPGSCLINLLKPR